MNWKPKHQTDPNKPRRITILPDSYELLWKITHELERPEQEVIHLALGLFASALCRPLKIPASKLPRARRLRGVEPISRYSKRLIATIQKGE